MLLLVQIRRSYNDYFEKVVLETHDSYSVGQPNPTVELPPISESRVVGTWQEVSADFSGRMVVSKDPTTFTFHPDHTLTQTNSRGETTQGNWSLEGNVLRFSDWLGEDGGKVSLTDGAERCCGR